MVEGYRWKFGMSLFEGEIIRNYNDSPFKFSSSFFNLELFYVFLFPLLPFFPFFLPFTSPFLLLIYNFLMSFPIHFFLSFPSSFFPCSSSSSFSFHFLFLLPLPPFFSSLILDHFHFPLSSFSFLFLHKPLPFIFLFLFSFPNSSFSPSFFSFPSLCFLFFSHNFSSFNLCFSLKRDFYPCIILFISSFPLISKM